MDDSILVQVSDGHGYVVGDVHLRVIGKRSGRQLKEMGQTLLHQFHEKNQSPRVGILHHAQEPDDVGMVEASHDLRLLLESSGEISSRGIVGREESLVEDFCGARKVIERGLDDAAVGPSAQLRIFREMYANFLKTIPTVQFDTNFLTARSLIFRSHFVSMRQHAKLEARALGQ